jgi:hypothetical protein
MTQSLRTTQFHDGEVNSETASPETLIDTSSVARDMSVSTSLRKNDDFTPRAKRRRSPAGTLCALQSGKPLSDSSSIGRQSIKSLRQRIRSGELALRAPAVNSLNSRTSQSADTGNSDQDTVISAPSSAISDTGPEIRHYTEKGSALQSELASDASQSRVLPATAYPSMKRARANEDEFISQYRAVEAERAPLYAYEDNVRMMGSDYFSDDAVETVFPNSSSRQSSQVDHEASPLQYKQTSVRHKTLDEADLIHSGYVHALPRGDVRATMLQAPVLERLVDTEWIKFSKAFQAYRTQGGDRSLYKCLAPGLYDTIIGYLNYNGYDDHLTLHNLEQHISVNEHNMFVHLQKICGIVHATKTKTEIQKVYEMPYDHPADFWAKNQQPLWCALIREDAMKERLSHEWTATTMLEGLKKNYPDLRNDLYRRLVAPFTNPTNLEEPNWIEISRNLEGAIHKEFQKYQMVKEVIKLRLKRDVALMCKVRELNAPCMMWTDSHGNVKHPTSKPTKDVEQSSNYGSGGRPTHSPRVNTHVAAHKPTTQPRHTPPRSHYQPQNTSTSNVNADMRNGKNAFELGKSIPQGASRHFKKAYYDAKNASQSSKQ